MTFTIHLPTLFTLLGILFVAVLVAVFVGGALSTWAFMHMDTGPSWYATLPIPGAVIAGLVTFYVCYRLT